MANIHDINESLQVQPSVRNLPTLIALSQGENGRSLQFRMVGATIPSGSSASLSGTKPDGVVYSKAGTVDGNTVIFQEDVQLTAVAGAWDAKIHIVNNGNSVATALIRFIIDPDPVAAGAVPSDSQLEGIVAECKLYAEAARSNAYGSPLTASVAADMIDTSKVYVYTGSETGYTAGHWYYYNGSVWADGGVYNSIAIQTDTTLTLPGYAADAKATGDALATKADKIGNIALAERLYGGEYSAESEPYHFRQAPDGMGAKDETIVGGSLGWNQLCNGSSVTVQSGHKYLAKISGTFSIGASDGTAITGLTSGTDMLIDLTTLFGSTIADYVYSLETANAGDGVAWVRKYLPNTYYAYCAPTLKHVSGVSAHVMRDANNNAIGNYPIDSTWTGMGIPKLDSNGKLYFDGDTYASDGTVTERLTLLDLGTIDWGNVNTEQYGALFYTDQLIGSIAYSDNLQVYTICNNYVSYPNFYDAPIGSPYNLPDKALRVRSSDGRLYFRSEADVGKTGAQFKAEMSGVMLAYLKLTPTTSSASPFTSPQICDPNGTEEYVTTGLVPVGHESKYYEDVAKKVSGLPKDFSTLIAPTEVTFTATRNYSVGSYLIVKNQLYKVTSAISSGGTITPNSNVTATTIMAEILALA